jgi:hypothetical protein
VRIAYNTPVRTPAVVVIQSQQTRLLFHHTVARSGICATTIAMPTCVPKANLRLPLTAFRMLVVMIGPLAGII